MAAEDRTLIGKSKLLYCERQVCTGVEIRTKQTAKVSTRSEMHGVGG